MTEHGYGFAPAPEFSIEKKEMTPEQLTAFVDANKIVISDANKISRCVDGRYEGIENFPVIAKPGGDAGDMMAAFGALNVLDVSLDGQAILNAVAEVAGGIQKIQFHTDDICNSVKDGLPIQRNV